MSSSIYLGGRFLQETVHARYKSLGEVEQAFRRSKTVELGMRPVHVRKESSTRGHLLVVMLAYLLMQELGKRWAHLDLTVKEGLARLNTYWPWKSPEWSKSFSWRDRDLQPAQGCAQYHLGSEA